MNKLTHPEDKPDVWVDAETIMKLLCIRPSTLKEYRRKSLLTWSQPNNGKILYLLQSALDLLEKNKRGGGGNGKHGALATE